MVYDICIVPALRRKILMKSRKRVLEALKKQLDELL
jgi:hypothetical protein